MHPLAELAVEQGLASEEDIKKAAEHADRDGVPLVSVLVRELGIDELELMLALKKSTRVLVTDPAKVEVDTEALRQISRDDCRRLRVVPLAVGVYDEGPSILRVAMADPTDAVVIAEVEHLSGCRVQPTLMTLSAVEELIERFYRHFVTKVIKRDESPPARPSPDRKAAISTVPFRRVIDDADATVRIEALVKLLIEKELIAEDEYEEAVRAVMKSRA